MAKKNATAEIVVEVPSVVTDYKDGAAKNAVQCLVTSAKNCIANHRQGNMSKCVMYPDDCSVFTGSFP